MAITADYTTLQRQASMTADDYLNSAVNSIDATFGKGYAQKNPALVAAYMQVCAKDMGVTTTVVAIQEAASEIASALRDIGQ